MFSIDEILRSEVPLKYAKAEENAYLWSSGMKRTAALTICSINYLAKAATLVDSYKAHHPEDDFYVVIVDRKTDLEHDVANAMVLWVEDLEIPDFDRKAFEFDVIELNTNIKPTAMATLLGRYDRVVYLDPDVFVYSRLEPVIASLTGADVVVTPHALSPIEDREKPDEVDLLRFGTFNLGFVGVAQTPEGFRFLRWWSARCLENGFYEPQSGLAVDQKWVNLAPAFFQGLRILRDPGLNVAFWNLHERELSLSAGEWLVNGSQKLYFVHFSSFDPETPGLVARKQTRFGIGSRGDFEAVASSYRLALRRNLQKFPADVRYSFDYFESGTYITPTLRRVYAAIKDLVRFGERPFDLNSGVERFARKNGLLEGNVRARKRASFQDIGQFGWQQRMVLRSLKLVLRALGPARYFALMRYMAYVSSIRNQGSAFVSNTRWSGEHR